MKTEKEVQKKLDEVKEYILDVYSKESPQNLSYSLKGIRTKMKILEWVLDKREDI